MFTTLRNVDLERNSSSIDPSALLRSRKTLHPFSSLERMNISSGAALEGFFGKSKEEKVKEFRDIWKNILVRDMDDNEKMLDIYNNLASTFKSNMTTYKTKLSGKRLEVGSIRTSGMSYTDLNAGIEGSIMLPEFVSRILSLSTSELFKNPNVLYTALKTPPSQVKRAFVVDWDQQLTFRPEYHYRGGSKIHESETLENLGYTDSSIMKLIAGVEACIEAYHKLAGMAPELKKQYDEYETLVIGEINRGVGPREYWNGLSNVTHVLAPFWYEATAYSIRGFAEKAVSIIKEVVIAN